jgi:hypothetical protein
LDGFAEQEFVVAGLESGELAWCVEVGGGDVIVEIVEKLDEGVGVAFGVSARISGIGAGFFAEQRRVLYEFAVWFVAAADPESVGVFGVPGERAFAAVNFEIQGALAAGADLRNGEDAVNAVLEMNEDGGVVVGFDRDFVGGDILGGGEGLDVAARLVTHGNDRREVGAKFGDFLAGDPLNEIEPVRADVGDGAEFATEFGFEAPVPVGGIGEPVLQKAAVDEADLADGTGVDERFGLNAKRIVAKIVRDAVDTIGFFGKGDELSGFARVHGQRLFAHDVFAGADQRGGLAEMDVVGRANVDGGDFGVGRDFFDAGVGAFEPEGFGGGGTAIAGTDEGAFDANRDAAKGFDVGFADESGSDDGGDVVHGKNSPKWCEFVATGILRQEGTRKASGIEEFGGREKSLASHAKSV